MTLSDGSTRRRIKLTHGRTAFYEDNIARQLRIMDEIRAITVTIDDPDVLEAVARRLATIAEAAGQTRRALIDERDAEQGRG